MTCDNPFFPVDNRNNIRSMILSFRRCWYVKMPNLTTPLGFVNAFNNGVVNTYWIRATTKQEGKMTMNVGRNMKIRFVSLIKDQKEEVICSFIG